MTRRHPDKRLLLLGQRDIKLRQQIDAAVKRNDGAEADRLYPEVKRVEWMISRQQARTMAGVAVKIAIGEWCWRGIRYDEVVEIIEASQSTDRMIASSILYDLMAMRSRRAKMRRRRQ